MNIEARLADLEQRLKDVEERLGPKPIIFPYHPEVAPQPFGGCAVCGMKFDGSMGYVCSNPLCPGGVTCR